MFSYRDSGKKIAILEPGGNRRWLGVSAMTVSGHGDRGPLSLRGCADAGRSDSEQCRRLFDLAGHREGSFRDTVDDPPSPTPIRRTAHCLRSRTVTGGWFDVEMEKLDRWAEDRPYVAEGGTHGIGRAHSG